MSKHQQRLDVKTVDPKATAAVMALEKYLGECDLDPVLRELVKIRASQMNGCAFCLDMHIQEARRHGEDQRRLDVVAIWHEAGDLFTEQECAALALTEAVTLIGEAGVPDAIWNDVTARFDEAATVQLLMTIVTINVWNRLQVATREALPDRPSN